MIPKIVFFSKHKKPTKLFPALLVLLAAFLRFWHLGELFHWTLDEEFWSYIPHNIATFTHIPLIGGHISGTGLYSGPLFVWLMGPVFFLIKSHPLGIATFVSLLGTLTTFLIYKLFSKSSSNFITSKIALLAAFFYATSTLAVIYDRKYWNASPIPFLSLITLFLVNKLRTKPSTKLVLALAFTLTLAFHAHMMGAVLVVFTLLAWFVYKLPQQAFIKLTLAFLFLQTPLFLFEVRHNFTNTNAVINLLSSTASTSTPPFQALTQVTDLTLTTFSRLVYTPATDISNELTLCPTYFASRSMPPLAAFFVGSLVLGYSFIKLKRKNPFALLLWTNIGLLILYRLIAPANSWYPGQLSEYFLLPSFVSFFILAADLASKALKKAPGITSALLIFLLIIHFHTIINLTHSYSFSKRNRLVNFALTYLEDKPFHLDVVGDQCQIYGYRYLFTIKHHEPSTSYLDPSFLWIYQIYLPSQPPQLNLTLYPETDTIKITPHEQAN